MNWLGGRDSNPDNLLQRQMSYRWTTSQHGAQGPAGGNFDYSERETAAASRARTRSRPSSASTSNKPGLTIFPVIATRTA